jgi:hypothetical protein
VSEHPQCYAVTSASVSADRELRSIRVNRLVARRETRRTRARVQRYNTKHGDNISSEMSIDLKVSIVSQPRRPQSRLWTF